MKACIVTYDEYINIPYVKDYEALLRENGIQFDIILWNRSEKRGADGFSGDKAFVFNWRTKQSKFSKLLPFYLWRKSVIKILHENCYDFLIICTTMPGVLIVDILTKLYNGKYLIDIRDYTYEFFWPYRDAVKKTILSSGITLISSRGFLEWLPCGGIERYVITNNITNTDPAASCKIARDKSPLVIGFVGGIRYYDVNKKIVDAFANNALFSLLYVGKKHPGCDLAEYCERHGISNVSFLPPYNNEDKRRIYESVDIINCIYGDDNLEVRTSVSNKLYDCALYKTPILVSKNTYISKIVEEYNLGLSVDIKEDNVSALLVDYLDCFNKNAFLEGCARFLDMSLSEKNAALKSVGAFFENYSEKAKTRT